jgi:predicted metal-dependent phosphoesterase TrpH
MRTVIFDVPATMTIERAAAGMVSMATAEVDAHPEENDDVQVVAEFNGIEMGATYHSKPADVVEQWDRKRIAREVRDARIRPVSEAIDYLLGTLSEEDRQTVLQRLQVDSMVKKG